VRVRGLRRGAGEGVRLKSAGASVAATAARGARWHVYLIECRDGSIYTGVAIDVAARYAAHVAGKGARYTRSHPPHRLLKVIACADRSDALKTEHAIKRLTAAEKRALCAGR